MCLRVDASRNVQGRKEVFANGSTGADTNENAQAAAHSRLVICVSLRMAASAEAPSSPMMLHPILQSMGKVGAVRG